MKKKEAWEKEAAYEDAFRSGRQAKDIWKYIPEKLKEAVEDTQIDSDGYWIFLDTENGWTAYDGGSDCGIIHVHSIADLKEDIKTIFNRNRKNDQDQEEAVVAKKVAHSIAAAKYNAKAVKQIKLNLNRKTDADVIQKLETCGNIQGYIKKLVRQDMQKTT